MKIMYNKKDLSHRQEGRVMIIEINSKIAENLSKTELGVVNYINDNEDKLSDLSIVDIAFETFSSRVQSHPQMRDQWV